MSDDEQLELPAFTNVPLLTPVKEWRQQQVREKGELKLVTTNLEKFHHKYHPHFSNPLLGHSIGPSIDLKSVKALKGVYTRATSFDPSAETVQEYSVVFLAETKQSTSRSKSFN
jgi:hypothetical protein